MKVFATNKQYKLNQKVKKLFYNVQNILMVKYINTKYVSLIFGYVLIMYTIKKIVPCEQYKSNMSAGQEIFFDILIYITYPKPGFIFHALMALKLFIFLISGEHAENSCHLSVLKDVCTGLGQVFIEDKMSLFHTTREHCWIIKIWLFFLSRH